MNDDGQAAFIHALNCTARRSDLVHMLGILKVSHARSWKSMRSRWMRNGEGLRLYESKSSEWMYMP